MHETVFTPPAWAVPLGVDAKAEAAVLAADCPALATADFSKIQDAPTRVISARLVEASGELPAYCQVQGLVLPSVGFELRLPTSNWNGKLFEAGCGGFCGNIPIAACEVPLRRGYACIATDMGNKGGRTNGLVFYNNLQAQIDFGFRGAHVTAVAGKAITESYYAKAPSKAYFMGCSSGGQQAFAEAQRFPWDFDGIIAGAPSPTFSGPMMYYEWAGRQLVGKLTPANLQLLHEKAVAKCDLDDGLKDGLIGYPPSCKFDPAELRCRSGGQSACLTGEQVEAVKKVYAGPMTSKGEKIYTGGPMVGSELNWFGPGPAYGNSSITGAYGNSDGSAMSAWPSEYFRYVGFMPAQGPEGEYRAFDFDRDYKRLGMAEALFGYAMNPDLRKFAAAGGKMILYNGWADQSDIPSDAIDYYEMAERTMGGRAATQQFFRLFLIPGMNHCWGGEGAFAIDYLSYLEAWVERGQAPDVMIGAHLTGEPGPAYKFPLDQSKVSFTRPVYPYPLQARYQGTGDPNNAANFRPVGP
ncbi:MAG: tannase/feruloyl esterase family alpha/beta hydrolase [Gemmatimonadetes bacterium]|nr:tannase/feruloyl esterase family alpha/beta hydrolase [Gemmatimonadota bacterium]